MRSSFLFALAAFLLAPCGCTASADRDEERSESVFVRAGGDLQEALDAARPGDVITLEAGATFTGPFELREKPGAEWITIRSSEEERLPTGVRVSPSDAGRMPKLEADSEAVITTEPGAHHYRFAGIEIRPKRGEYLVNLVTLGWSESSAKQVPHHIVFERCYLHGDPVRGTRRGIALNSAETEVLDSYFADFKEVGADSQALAGWNGPGPFRIENNTLEGAGENVMFGGEDPAIPNLVPADIVIRRNHFRKPLAWKAGEPEYQGTPWSVKNLFELKNARRVTVERNLFENNWAHMQNGFAILFTVRNQGGAAPWSVVEDVTFANNVVRHTGSGVSILGRDDNFESGQTRGITIRNNLFEDIDESRWGGSGRFIQILHAAADVVIEHNTALHSGNVITAEGPPHEGFVFRDNIALHNEYGITGTGLASGEATLEALFPRAVVRRNVLVGGGASPLPSDNFVPGSLDDVGFIDIRAGNYRLRDGSPYKNRASDGKDIGVDYDALEADSNPTRKAPE